MENFYGSCIIHTLHHKNFTYKPQTIKNPQNFNKMKLVMPMKIGIHLQSDLWIPCLARYDGF
jgi:hypothetical protein